MHSISDNLAELHRAWSEPRKAKHRGEEIPFLLACSYSPSSGQSIDERLPPSLRDFWTIAESARLFEDREYGQWGLQILSPRDAEKMTAIFWQERRVEAREGDLIIGRFLGDSDLLLVRGYEQERDFGSVMVVLALDPRSEWYRVASSLESFLERYTEAAGDKYWEL